MSARERARAVVCVMVRVPARFPIPRRSVGHAVYATVRVRVVMSV